MYIYMYIYIYIYIHTYIFIYVCICTYRHIHTHCICDKTYVTYIHTCISYIIPEAQTPIIKGYCTGCYNENRAFNLGFCQSTLT